MADCCVRCSRFPRILGSLANQSKLTGVQWGRVDYGGHGAAGDKQARTTAMMFIRPSSIERKGTARFAGQSANTLPLYPLRL